MKRTLLSLFLIVASCVLLKAQNFWTKVYTDNNFDVRSFCETDNGYMYSIRSSRSLLRSTNDGNTWASFTPTSGYPTKNTSNIAGYQNNLYLVNFDNSTTPYKGKGFLVSTDFGANWTQKINGLGADTALTQIEVLKNGNILVNALRYDNNNSENVNTLYISTNGGDSWAVSRQRDATSSLFYVTENDNGDIFLSEGDKFLKSTNGGVSWTDMNAVNYYYGGAIYVASNDSFYVDASSQIAGSKDGINWSRIDIVSGWQTPQTTNAFELGNNDTMYVALTGGTTDVVMRSADKGKTWTDFSSGVTGSKTFLYLWISPRTGYMFGSVFQTGIFKTNAKVGAIASTPTGILSSGAYADKFSLQVSPNPAVSETKVNYHLATPETISMRLLDQQGKVAMVLMNQVSQGEGDYTTGFDISSLNMGIYYLHIVSDKGSSVKKIVKGQ